MDANQLSGLRPTSRIAGSATGMALMQARSRPPVLTIDGPSGAGKGAVSAAVARRLEWNALDSGAVYRSVALAALEHGVAQDDAHGLVALTRNLCLTFRAGIDGIDVFMDGRDVGDSLRTEQV